MPKIKTHSGAKKRFKITKNGKVLHSKTNRLIDIIPQQRLTMRSSDDDTTTIGHCLRPGNFEESRCASMHSRPDGISSQT